jgi:predicted MFS family arabinose efflux permease
LQVALVVFATGSAWAALAHAPWELIAARAVMGAAGAFALPATLAIITNIYPPDKRIKAISVWAMIAGVSVAVGVLWSGFLIDHFSWGSVFWTNVVIAGLAIVAGIRILPITDRAEHIGWDVPGVLLAVVALASLVWAIIEAPEWGWTNPAVIALFTAAALGGVAFVVWERRCPEPLLNIGYFHDRRFSLGALNVAVPFLVLNGLFFVLVQWLQLVKGYSAFETGLWACIGVGPQAATSLLSPMLVRRWGYRPVMTLGLATLALALVILSTLNRSGPTGTVVIGFALIGAGMGLSSTPATGAILWALPRDEAGVGSAVNDVSREVGSSLGVAIMGSLLAVRFRAGIGHVTKMILAAGTADHRVGQAHSAVTASRRGLGPALEVASRLRVISGGGGLADQLTTAARHSFTTGLGLSLLGAAVIATGAACAVWLLMPAAMRPEIPAKSPESASITA